MPVYQRLSDADSPRAEIEGFLSSQVSPVSVKSSGQQSSSSGVSRITNQPLNIAVPPARDVVTHHTHNNDTKPSRFIRLVGVPPPNSDGTITSQPVELVGTDPRNHVIDILDADNEDPFTLENLEDLIHLHAKKGLDFILARVTTVDPEDEQRFYYSYYAAHHINKVLFRTQPEVGLLHRMRAKNPLNNMTIVGDVHYYVIASSLALEKMKELDKYKSKKSPLKMIADLIAGPIKSAHNNNSETGGYGVSEDSIRKFKACSGVQSPGKKTLKMIARPEAFEEEVYQSELINPKHAQSSSFREPRSDNRRSSFDDAYSSRPHYSGAKNTILPSRNGNPEIIQKRAHKNKVVRSYAFCNSRERVTLNEWVHIQALNKSKSNYNSPDSIKSGASWSPAAQNNSASTSPTLSIPTSGSSLCELFYEAVYYGCDDDFLMKASVRSYFKENALEDNDAVLFTLLAPTETNPTTNPAEQHPALSNFLYSVTDNDDGLLSFRNLNSRKLIRWVLLIYVVCGFIFVKFFVPAQHILMTLFVLVFLFCLVLIVIA